MEDLQARIKKTDSYRTQINYEYWLTLSLAEQEERTVTARRLIYEAEELNAQAEIDDAKEKYLAAFELWAEIYDDYPLLTVDDSAEELYESIRRYMVAIDSQDLPEDFPLAAFAGLMGREGKADSSRYAKLREEQKRKSIERQKELDAEERRREEAAAKSQDQPQQTDSDADQAGSSDQSPQQDQPDKDSNEPEGDTTESDADAGDSKADADTTESNTDVADSDAESVESDQDSSDQQPSESDSDPTPSDQ